MNDLCSRSTTLRPLRSRCSRDVPRGRVQRAWYMPCTGREDAYLRPPSSSRRGAHRRRRLRGRDRMRLGRARRYLRGPRGLHERRECVRAVRNGDLRACERVQPVLVRALLHQRRDVHCGVHRAVPRSIPGEGAATEIADCSSAVRSLSCEELIDPVIVTYYDPHELLTSCPVTPGVFGAGERCLRDGDCTTGHCAWRGGCGTCVAPVAPLTFRRSAEACTSDDACASGRCSSGKCGRGRKARRGVRRSPVPIPRPLHVRLRLPVPPFGPLPWGSRALGSTTARPERSARSERHRRDL